MAERIHTIKLVQAWNSVYISKIIDAFLLYIAMSLSRHLVGNMMVGGAFYLCGQILVVFFRLLRRRNSELLPHSIQARGVALFIAVFLLNVILLIVYPTITLSGYFGPMLLSIILLLLRQAITELCANRLRLRTHWRMLLLLGLHAGFVIGISIQLNPYVNETAFHDLLTMIEATGMAMLVTQLRERQAVQKHAPSADRLLKVSSYRVFNRMTSNIIISLNLALLGYICYMQFEPENTMLERFWNLAVWLTLIGGVTILMLQFFRHRLSQYDKPSVFVVGIILLVIDILGIYYDWFLGIWSVVGYLLWGIGLACIFAIIISMGEDMKQVLELDMPPEEYEGYEENTRAVAEWNLTLSTFLLLLMMTGITFLAEGKLEAWLQDTVMQLRWLMVLPPLFALAALLYALMQPLNKDYARKLARYRAQQRIGKANPALETRLQLMLVKRTRQVLPSILRAIIRPLMPCTVIGKENVRLDQGPVVFVSNHLEVYGPLITNLHLPFYFRSWIIANMLDRDIIEPNLKSGVEILFKWVPARLRKKLPGLFAPILLCILKSLDPIPVYRGNIREILKTLHATVDAMEYEDNILIFPENTVLDDGQYKVQGISPFYSGFASIGSEYYKRTGNATTFYPMYANRDKRTLTIGEGVRYNHENGHNTEKMRIVSSLFAWMCNAAEQGENGA